MGLVREHPLVEWAPDNITRRCWVRDFRAARRSACVYIYMYEGVYMYMWKETETRLACSASLADALAAFARYRVQRFRGVECKFEVVESFGIGKSWGQSVV